MRCTTERKTNTMTTLLLTTGGDGAAASAVALVGMFWLALFFGGLIMFVVWTLLPFIVWAKFNRVIESLARLQKAGNQLIDALSEVDVPTTSRKA
jgi:hypothetical protein